MQRLKVPQIQGEDERVGSRALLGATAAYGILGVVALVAFGTLPASSETGEQLVTWFRENRDAVRWGVWAFTVAAPLFALMVALLRRLLPAPHRDMFLIGAVTYMAAIAVWTWTWAGLALHADQLEPATARAILDVAVFFGPVLTGSTTTMMAPVTLLAFRRQPRIPRWLGALGLIAFVEQAVETITIFGSTGFTQPGGAMNMQLGGALTLAWILAFGFWGGVRARGRVSGRASGCSPVGE
jgi:Domain of unknown function (DUF4386)